MASAPFSIRHTAFAVLVALSVTAAACTSDGDLADSTTTETTAATEQSTAITESSTTVTPTTTASEPEATSSLRLIGEPLPPASQRHQEGEPVVGTMAPRLEADDLVIPGTRPTLLLTVVGSCADCKGAADALTALADEFDAQAVLLTNASAPTSISDRWTVIVDDEAARAYAGRDRPTALVIGLDGGVLSRVRPFNQSGTEYDELDLRFALQIAANQTLGTDVERFEFEQPPAVLPTTAIAVTSEGDALEVSTADGSTREVLTAAPVTSGDEIEPNSIDEVSRLPDGTLLVNECCEPAGGLLFLTSDPEQLPFGGWETALSSDGGLVAISGYERSVSSLANASITTLTPLGASNGSAPDVAWLRHTLGVVYLHRGNTNGVAEIIEFDTEFRPISRRSYELQGPASAVTVNAAGDIVVLSSPFGSDEAIGQVYDTTNGQLLAEFPIADGTEDIDYDASGTYLISVDGQGTIRWQGAGESGELGSGFRSAHW